MGSARCLCMEAYVMPAAAETRIGRTDMPLRGMNPSYNIGSPATSIGRVVFASATWGRPRNPQARGKRGSPASILSVMRAASHHYVSFPARNGLDLETAQLSLARPELSSTKTIAVRRGMNSLLTINSLADVALDTLNSLSARAILQRKRKSRRRYWCHRRRSIRWS